MPLPRGAGRGASRWRVVVRVVATLTTSLAGCLMAGEPGTGTATAVSADPAAGAATAETWWAAQPLVRPPVPGTGAGPRSESTPPPPATPPATANGSVHPIDAWVRANASAAAGGSGPSVDRRTLLRRLMVDLHGLLPTPDEVRDFVDDPASDDAALAGAIDRLLASPRYGERWARHWLDVVHFAETHGHDQDRPRDHAWPYRDYVIAAFNGDTPYPRFVQEQIAADALFPDQPELTPALGFLAAGPWDESSLRDIREDVLDREIGRYLDRDDIVANVMSTFAGVTAHCARCHDHKFDPISQRDYFALQAVFAGTEKAERLYDLDPETNRRRRYWMEWQVALDRRDAALVDRLLTPALRADQAAWERFEAVPAIDWQPLADLRWQTRHGVDLVRQADGSLLATGPNPPEEVYTVEAPTGLAGVTAIRLEVLPDPSLPKQGPGRAENGNLHLTEFEVFVESSESTPAASAPAPAVAAAGDAAGGGLFVPVPVRHPTADFDQEGWDIAKAVDGDPQTAWGIHPQEGRAHTAVFEIGTPVPSAWTRSNAVVRVVLAQGHGRQHTLGRFRLSVTAHPPPVRASPLPPAVARALARSAAERTAAEQFDLTAHYFAGRVARELGALPAPLRVYAGASVFPANANQKPLGRPRPIQRLRRGEITQPQEEAEPGALSCIAGLPSRFGADPDEGARRAALARWLTDPGNPLIWRTFVNRVWHYHFGRGIVATPNDFGRMGAAPSDARLLDWLAVVFRDDLAGSAKALHRLILTSRTWRQASADPVGARPLQPLRRRLDAETYRDSLLRMAGRLDLTPGGPSVRQFAMSDGIHVTPNVDYGAFDLDSAGGRRRSIYRFLFRTLPDPMMDALDCPAGDLSTPQRAESFTALQAFALLHHPFVVRQSEHLAAVVATVGDDPREQVRELYARVHQREPGPAELAACAEHVRVHGLADLARLLVNGNEFHFVE